MLRSLTEIDSQPAANRARKFADRFSLPLNEHNWRGIPGDFAGVGVGSSLDFQDHRNYLPGDDPRHINWQAYARTGDYSMKLYREEVRPIVEIVMDVSGSMFALPDKAERALELFYFTSFSADRSGASMRIFLVNGPLWKQIEPHSISTHHWKSVAAELDGTDSSGAPAVSSIPFRQRSMRVFVSDLLFLTNPETVVRSLQKQQGRAVFLCPFSSSEADPGWNGNYEFIDTETTERHDRRVDSSLLKRYLDSYRRHFDRWKAAAIRAQTPFARISSLGPFEESVRKEAIPSGALQLS
ncbi:MAG: DUF58 domain-containing protein [Verrucomicrobiota bacterium]